MADKVRQSFDQYAAKKGESGALKKAREAYEAAVKKLAATKPDDPTYGKVREDKRLAAVAMSETRQADEAKYYEEEVEENVKAITEMKAANAAPATAMK